jgi:hypothetical protein
VSSSRAKPSPSHSLPREVGPPPSTPVASEASSCSPPALLCSSELPAHPSPLPDNHQSAHRAAGPLLDQLLPAGYLSTVISSGHRNGVTPLSTSARCYWLSRRHRGARRPGSGRAVGVVRHCGELHRGSRPRTLGRGRPAGLLAICRLGRRVGCTVTHGTMCLVPHGYYATRPRAEVGPNGQVYFVSF